MRGRVCEPELVADGRLSSHPQYRLLTLASAGHPHEGVHDVRRRFSDFDAIAKILAARYAGMVLPPLPPKANPLQQRADDLGSGATSSSKRSGGSLAVFLTQRAPKLFSPKEWSNQ